MGLGTTFGDSDDYNLPPTEKIKHLIRYNGIVYEFECYPDWRSIVRAHKKHLKHIPNRVHQDTLYEYIKELYHPTQYKPESPEIHDV